MAGLSWQRRGTFKRQRAIAQIDGAAIEEAVVDRYEDEAPSYDCGDCCDMCVPDWRDRDELRKRIARSQPVFTLAERLLAQVGLVLRQIPA